MRAEEGSMRSPTARDAAMIALGMALALAITGIATRAQGRTVRTYISPNGATELTVLLDKETFGTELDVGEMTMPAGLDSGEHAHQSSEIFYVISGELEHVVNGRSELLKPGMVGFVRPPDKVRHRVPGPSPVRTLVIWTPGGEAARIAGRWKPKS
jgi:quercetin dioxygenase-like cupin family protein